ETDALIAIDWMSKTIREEKHYTTFDRVVPKFLESVFNSSDIGSVRSKLAEFLLEATRDGGYWFYDDSIKKSFADLLVNNDRRKALIVSILHNEAQNAGRDQAVLLSWSIPLLTREDLPWLVSLLVDEVKEETKRSLANIIVGQTFGHPLDQISFVWDAADDYPFLLDALTRAYTIDLSSAVAKWQREDFERKRRKAAEEQAHPFDMAGQIQNDLA